MKRLAAALATTIALTILAAPTATADDTEPTPPAVTIVERGPKPHNQWDTDRRRSCKAKARVEERAQEVLWTPAERTVENVIVETWEPQFWTTDYTRIFPTPRGCVLRHKEWMRHHHGAAWKANR